MKNSQIFFALSLVGFLSIAVPSQDVNAAWKADVNGRYYTADTKTGYITGWKKIGSHTYYFKKSKYAATGWTYIQKNWYYFDARGRMASNTWVDGFYLRADGIRDDSATQNTGLEKEPETASTQVLKNTWVQENGSWYYHNAAGKRVKGFLTIKKTTYYMDPQTGARMGGVIRIDNKYYYFDPKTGVQKTGYIIYDGNGYYFDPKTKEGLKGWQKIKNYYYYFNSKCVLQRNKWIKNTYYVDQLGRRQYGWTKIGNYTYYFQPGTGMKTTGKVKIKNYYYRFRPGGAMYTDTWAKKQYYDKKGRMAVKKWIAGKYVDSYGYVIKTRERGFYQVRNNTYYVKDDYNLAKKTWMLIDTKYYYFNAKGILQKNKWQDGFYINKNGTRVVDQFMTIEKKTYRFDSLGNVIKGLTSRDDKTYYMDPETGVMKTGFCLINGVNYYFDPKTGVMATDQILVINDSVYKFDKSGAATLDASNYGLGKAIAEYAQKFIGYPYVFGGDTNLKKGVDCSGFTMLVFRHFNLNIPRVAAAQANGTSAYGGPFAEAKYISEKNLLPGDIICYYSPVSHVGIYIGDGKIVHASNSAPYPQGGIKISNYNYTKISKIVRYW